MNSPQPAPLLPLGRSGLRANLKFAGLVVVMLPVLVVLGFWQLARAHEKEALLAQVEARRAAVPDPLSSFIAGDGAALDGRRVELRGRYDADHAFLLDNQVLHGRVGYEVLSAFRDEGGALVIVDRGWVQAPPTRAELPLIDTPRGELLLHGEFHVPSDRRRLELHPGAAWPRVVQALDVPALARLAGSEGFPHLVRIAPDQPGAYPSEHPRVNITPARHVAYAVQWFGLAIALATVFLLGGTNLREWWRHSPRPENDLDQF